MKRHKITKVDEGGIAEELGIEEGDFLLAINDKEIEDIFDYDFIVNDEYLERVRNMYYRSRNHTCIIGFALGGESGNGYNMYKAYQWLKSVEPSRPVICIDADGEWNTDLEIVP